MSQGWTQKQKLDKQERGQEFFLQTTRDDEMVNNWIKAEGGRNQVGRFAGGILSMRAGKMNLWEGRQVTPETGKTG